MIQIIKEYVLDANMHSETKLSSLLFRILSIVFYFTIFIWLAEDFGIPLIMPVRDYNEIWTEILNLSFLPPLMLLILIVSAFRVTRYIITKIFSYILQRLPIVELGLGINTVDYLIKMDVIDTNAGRSKRFNSHLNNLKSGVFMIKSHIIHFDNQLMFTMLLGYIYWFIVRDLFSELYIGWIMLIILFWQLLLFFALGFINALQTSYERQLKYLENENLINSQSDFGIESL